jgi:hypothetical protein
MFFREKEAVFQKNVILNHTFISFICKASGFGSNLAPCLAGYEKMYMQGVD